jgi:hypothetical protein
MSNWKMFVFALSTSLVQLGCNDDSGSHGGSCASFSACGGDITGTWIVDDICVEGDLGAELASEAGVPSKCNDLYQNIDITVGGTISYANGVETPNITMNMTMVAHYTEACLSAIAGQKVSMNRTICDALQSASTDEPTFASATCELSGGACDCTLTNVPTTLTDTDTYTVTGKSLTYADGNVVDYCATNTTLNVRKTAGFGSLSAQFTAHR